MNAMVVLIYVIIILVAIKKGQVEAHAFPIVFFFGIMGCLYVVALPDLVIREQNEDILTALMEIKGRR